MECWYNLCNYSLWCVQRRYGMVARSMGVVKSYPQQRGKAMDRATFALPRVLSDKSPGHQEFSPISTWARRRLGNIDHEKRRGIV